MYSSLASQTQPPLAWIALSIFDTENDSRWGWLGLVCDTTETERRLMVVHILALATHTHFPELLFIPAS